MNTLTFRNPGLIDPKCITTIGVSVKEGSNPIGYFGTGLKYAIAIILRTGGKITVWRGKVPYTFTAAEVEIRGRPASLVHMNGQELAFTTHLGATWEPWQAFRELWCNAKDEGGETVEGVVAAEEGWTTIIVTSQALMDAFRQQQDYLIDPRVTPSYRAPEAEFYEGPCASIFYRGINVGKNYIERTSAFKTNILSPISLTEDRMVSGFYPVITHIVRAITLCDDREFLRRWLAASCDTNMAEAHYPLESYAIDNPSTAFLDVAGEVLKDTSLSLNKSLMNLYVKHRRAPDLVVSDLLATEREDLDRAIQLCCEMGYRVNEFPILVMETLGESVLGKADTRTKTILLSKKAFDMGNATLAGTLLEEWAHLKHGYQDCSRPFQNWLVDQVIRMGRAYTASRTNPV